MTDLDMLAWKELDWAEVSISLTVSRGRKPSPLVWPGLWTFFGQGAPSHLDPTPKAAGKLKVPKDFLSGTNGRNTIFPAFSGL